MACLLAPGLGQAQALGTVAQPDCMLQLLGRPLTDPAVREAFLSHGIAIRPESVKLPLIAMPQQGVLLRTSAGVVTEIRLFNDSIPHSGATYRQFRGALPLGLTFSDSVGLEENRLFQQRGAEFTQTSEGINTAQILTLSDGLAYHFQQAYLPAMWYHAYKRSNPSVRLHRTLWYGFKLEREPKGRYISLPLWCGPGPFGSLSNGMLADRRDSSYFVSFSAGYKGLAESGRIRRALRDGFTMGLDLNFPAGKRISPPLMHLVGFNYAIHNYADSTSLVRLADNSAPSHTTFSLHYGLAWMPWGRRPGLVPWVQLIGGPQFDNSPTLQFYQNGATVRSSSSTWFYQLGGGLGYQWRSGNVVQLMAQYRNARFVRFVQFYTDPQRPFVSPGGATFFAPDLTVTGSRVRSLSIELVVRFNLGPS